MKGLSTRYIFPKSIRKAPINITPCEKENRKLAYHTLFRRYGWSKSDISRRYVVSWDSVKGTLRNPHRPWKAASCMEPCLRLTQSEEGFFRGYLQRIAASASAHGVAFSKEWKASTESFWQHIYDNIGNDGISEILKNMASGNGVKIVRIDRSLGWVEGNVACLSS